MKHIFGLFFGFMFLWTPLVLQGQNFIIKAAFNTAESATTPAFYRNGIVYSSNRKNTIFKTYLNEKGEHTYDLFYHGSDSVNKDLKQFLKLINGPLDEGKVTFTSSWDTIYFSATYKTAETEIKSGIFSSYQNKKDTSWSVPKLLPFITPEYNYGQPSLSPSGKSMFFVSDKPGYGKADIWVSEKDHEGIWSEPVNLGKNINTGGNEITPFAYKDTILYFSSDKNKDHKLDIYQYNLSKKSTVPFPLSFINSSNNDFGFIRRDNPPEYYWTNDKEGKTNIFYLDLQEAFDACNYVTDTNFCREFTVGKTMSDSVILKWDFGDSSVGEGMFVKHCYDKTGDYMVHLDLIDQTSGLRYEDVGMYKVNIQAENVVKVSKDSSVFKSNTSTKLSHRFKEDQNFTIWSSGFKNDYDFGNTFNYTSSYAVYDSITILVYNVQKDSTLCSVEKIKVLNETSGLMLNQKDQGFALNMDHPLEDMLALFPYIKGKDCLQNLKNRAYYQDDNAYFKQILSCYDQNIDSYVLKKKGRYLLIGQ